MLTAVFELVNFYGGIGMNYYTLVINISLKEFYKEKERGNDDYNGVRYGIR